MSVVYLEKESSVMLACIRREPAAVSAFASAVCALGLAIWVNFPSAAVMGVVTTGLFLAVRSQVVPVAAVAGRVKKALRPGAPQTPTTHGTLVEHVIDAVVNP